MKQSARKPDVAAILGGLKDFQRRSVDYVFGRLYKDSDCVDRFLIADEVGLGKTLVARGVIARAVEKLWNDVRRIDVVYICANRDIARQNINRLNIIPENEMALATRLTMLPLHHQDLEGNKVNFISFTPGTSFDLRSKSGIVYERVLIYQMLKEELGWQDSAGPKNVMRSSVHNASWRWYMRNYRYRDIDAGLQARFLSAVRKERDLLKRFNKLSASKVFRHARKNQNVPPAERQERDAIIGDLRRLLARSCLSALEPDLIILDEFQRFRNLLEGEDEVAQLAHALFEYPDAKVLLLSATPYKMYTLDQEIDEEDHYRDFGQTIRFLFNSHAHVEEFEKELTRYRKGLYRLGQPGDNELQAAKMALESRLKRCMVRTERLASTHDRDGMLVESHGDLGVPGRQELISFSTVDKVAQTIGERDVVEYWKSAPYLLNLMDRSGYNLKKHFVMESNAHKSARHLHSILDQRPESLLSWDDIRQYQEIDPGNSKLRNLLANTLDHGLWKLLWMPPSYPYYRAPGTPYGDAQTVDATKALVFSSWQVVPKAISMLSSYYAEQKMVNMLPGRKDYVKERRTRRPLLRFSISKGRLAGMATLALLYPCLTLAHEIDPLQLARELQRSGELPDSNEILKTVEAKLRKLLKPIISEYSVDGGQSDERWYWASLILLDRVHHRSSVRRWIKCVDDETDLSWKGMVRGRSGEEEESGFAEHVDDFFRYLKSRRRLGRPPEDLCAVLSKIAIAAPATVALRTFIRVFKIQNLNGMSEHVMAAAAHFGLGLRTLFNLPESMTLVRGLYQNQVTRYWESVINYCLAGNLQSVTDEYAHVLRESLGLFGTELAEALKKMSGEMSMAVSIRTVNLDFDDIQLDSGKIELERHGMRCRFALRFGDEKDPEDGTETRKDQVRSAFNSPFRPFILATTSIGQEGLDFHQYCHEVYHWNLPSNPVDLEQREGRIHRYKGHVIRRNIARAYPIHELPVQEDYTYLDPWRVLFEIARQKRDANQNDIVPFWVFEHPGGYKIVRHVPALPLSRETLQIQKLRESLVAYRMVFGQPRQEDLLEYLQSRLGEEVELEDLLQYRIDLSPPENKC